MQMYLERHRITLPKRTKSKLQQTGRQARIVFQLIQIWAHNLLFILIHSSQMDPRKAQIFRAHKPREIDA